MKRQTTLKMIKAVCWTGVAAGALWAVALAWPKVYSILTGLMAVAFTGYFTGQSASPWIPVKTVLLFAAMARGFYTANRIAKETQYENHT